MRAFWLTLLVCAMGAPVAAEMEVRIAGWDDSGVMRPAAPAPSGERAAANFERAPAPEWTEPEPHEGPLDGSRGRWRRRSTEDDHFRYEPGTELRKIWREQTTLNYLRGRDLIKAYQPRDGYKPATDYKPSMKYAGGRSRYGLSR